MIPLIMTSPGEKQTIALIRGREETRRYLESMGFIVGANISIVSEFNGNIIVNVKDTRVALDKGMAAKILCLG